MQYVLLMRADLVLVDQKVSRIVIIQSLIDIMVLPQYNLLKWRSFPTPKNLDLHHHLAGHKIQTLYNETLKA